MPSRGLPESMHLLSTESGGQHVPRDSPVEASVLTLSSAGVQKKNPGLLYRQSSTVASRITPISSSCARTILQAMAKCMAIFFNINFE